MFRYNNDELYCENIPVADIAKSFGTPVYVYSANTIHSRVNIIKDAFSEIADCTISLAIKANNNLSILKMLVAEGLGADIISPGELHRYLTAGGDASKVMFAGVAKSANELGYAIDKKIGMFNLESLPELMRLNEIARAKNVVVNAAIRINPNVEAGTHDKITTGKSGGKFGMSADTLKANLSMIKALTNVKLIGLDIHIGSQILSVEPYIQAYKVVAGLIKDMQALGLDMQVLDIGGGYGIPYEKEKGGFDFAQFKRDAVPLLKAMNVKIIVEPGRFITAESGALLMKVEYIKQEWGKTFVIVNAGMNDYVRVAMYDAYNDVLPAVKREGSMTVDVAGPACESSDFFAKSRNISTVAEGDLLALTDTGSYGMCMASNYNARPYIAEVLVNGNDARLIRKRQTLDDLLIYEKDLM